MPAAALSFGMRRMSRPEKSPRFENTVRMGKAIYGASASNIPRTSGCSRRMKGFFSSTSVMKAAMRMTGVLCAPASPAWPC